MSTYTLPFQYLELTRRLPKESLRPSTVPARSLTLPEVVHYGFPGAKMNKEMRQWKTRNLSNLARGAWRIITARKLGIPALYGQLCLAVIAPDGHRTDYGLVSLRMITSVGAAFVSTCFRGEASLPTMKYHGIGGGGTPESVSDIALGSEFSSVYDPVSTRATGIASVGAASNFYRSIGFITVSDTVTIAEHGLFNQEAADGGILLDRSAISSETIFANFTIQADFRLEIATGT